MCLAAEGRGFQAEGLADEQKLKKDLASCMCMIDNAHIDSFREGIRSSRNVQLGGVVNFLGVPFNIASYALLTMMVAQVCDLQLGEFIWTGGDCHLYANHLEQTELQLTREPLPLPLKT